MSFRAETLPLHSPPGNLDDLTDANKKLWSEDRISAWMNQEINQIPYPVPGPCGTERGKLSQFFDGTVTPFETGQQGVAVTWKAFPGIVKSKFGDDVRWAVADYSRMVQDEYCEWSVSRDRDNKILNATFTCEGPEYWQFIADFQDDVKGHTITDLYNKLMPQARGTIKKSEIYLKDENTGQIVYNPCNEYNIRSDTGYIAHLIQPANTLGAEVDISAQATVRRIDKNGNLITDPAKLINCSKYGQPLRNSDPTIGSVINNAANGGNSVSLKDPIALYMQSWDPLIKNVTLDDVPILKVPGLITWVRGAMPQGLRFTIQVPIGYRPPDGTPRTVSDIWDGNTNQNILYASQLMDYLNMSVSAVVIGNFPLADAERCPCELVKETPAGDLLDAPVQRVPYRKHRY
ncbi:hypothetical protein TWF281_004590 [Arthrobotrys megalospora]